MLVTHFLVIVHFPGDNTQDWVFLLMMQKILLVYLIFFLV